MCPAPETNKRAPQPAQVELNAWRPSAAQPVLRARAQMLAGIRAFFAAREVLEVETPMLSQAATTDPALASMRVAGLGYWLHTSPELPMKRLLAAGLGPIYQICRVFRDGERGRLHHPEFTLLEWYRPGWTLSALMQEVADLVHDLLHRLELSPELPPELTPKLPVEFIRYRELFQRELDIDPWHCSPRELQAVAQARGLGAGLKLDTDAWLDFLLTHCLEPQLGQHGLSFVQDYPPSQAALARLSEDDPPHAQRFELYWQGIELANGFQELTDAAQQRQRFAQDQAVRAASGLAPVAQDEQFLAALEAGLPESAGVALGLDRLLMLACGASCIDQVLAFPIERA